ncbi:DUF6383 domain-containing protein [uncultured Parabacteroides sp.]|uniref:DUF6383 domain-containing protein n=5 Tax=uncultured Parabacteroides sp. TaxID=512312 RepID=UPI0025CEB761|nr:DUF6383 domain-containing protein [uncultured Parabacteroides sp.]
MNKKFSTLVASVLLASSVGATAQTFTPAAFSSEPEIRQAKYYALGVGGATDVVSVTETADGTLVFKQVAANSLTSLAKVDSALWTVAANVTGDGGATRFVLTNKATGVTFSFDPKNAVKETGTATTAATGKAAEVGGTLTQWIWYNSRYNVSNSLNAANAVSMDFSNGDSTLVVRADNTSKVIYAAKDSKQKLNSGLTLQILNPKTWVMSPADLNTKGEDVKYMQLAFSGDAAKNNPFAEKYQVQRLAANNIDTAKYVYEINVAQANQGWTLVGNAHESEWLFLNRIEDGKLSNKYAHVDTAYFKSKGATYKTYNTINKGTQAAIVKPNGGGIDTIAYNLPLDAFRFKFTKDLVTDSIKVEAQSSFVELNHSVDPFNKCLDPAYKEKVATFWSLNTSNAKKYSNFTNEKAQDVNESVYSSTVLSHCTLEGEVTKVVTFYTDDAGKATDNHVNLLAFADGIDSDYASIPDGVYTIKNVSTKEYYGVHIYDADSVAEYTGGDVIKNMNFNHIPAFQWVVIKKDHSDLRADVSPVQITNREFATKNDFQIQLRKGSKDGQYKLNGVEVIFEPVSADAVADKHNGYKFLEDQDLDVNRYTFNYWHAYTADKYLNKNSGDSILNVLTEDAGRFSIEAAKAAEFGYDVDAHGANTYIPTLAQLERRLYTVYAPYGRKLYVNKERQIMATTTPATTDAATSFYFKENNEFTKGEDLTCYYALINNNGVNKAGVVDNDEDALLRAQVMTETRTSVFAIAKSDAPLYRRFNNTALGESAKDGCDSLRFFETVRHEYLMDENNREGGLMDANVNYVGMWTADKATGLAFQIDSAVINRDNGDIKPQYLISVAHRDFAGTDTIACTEADGTHRDEQGNLVDAKHCIHATPGVAAFQRGKYLVSFADSAAANGNKKPYTDITSGYVRAGFVEAIKQADTLWVLTDEFKALENEKIDFARMQVVNDSLVAAGATKIKNVLTGVNHKNYTWSFRYVHPEIAANVGEEGTANSFLFESGNYDGEKIAPENGAWLKIQNGCVVLTKSPSLFSNAKTGGDGALIFNVENKANDEMATDNETIATSEVAVIAQEGAVRIANAEGKKVVITNILGQVVANTVITSSDAVIAAPQGVVVVAVEGEEAVKAIVK